QMHAKLRTISTHTVSSTQPVRQKATDSMAGWVPSSVNVNVLLTSRCTKVKTEVAAECHSSVDVINVNDNRIIQPAHQKDQKTIQAVNQCLTYSTSSWLPLTGTRRQPSTVNVKYG